jgi:hypothetical protein
VEGRGNNVFVKKYLTGTVSFSCKPLLFSAHNRVVKGTQTVTTLSTPRTPNTFTTPYHAIVYTHHYQPPPPPPPPPTTGTPNSAAPTAHVLMVGRTVH